MRKLVFIKESTVFIVFLSFIVLLFMVLFINDYWSEQQDNQHSIKTTELIVQLDSIQKIQDDMHVYDSLNRVDTLLKALTSTFDSVLSPSQLVPSNNLDTQSVRLKKYADSLDFSISQLESQIEKTEVLMDSISPQYNIQFRDSLLIKKDSLNNQLLSCLNLNVIRLRKGLTLYSILRMLLYAIPTILYPIRWVLLLLFKHTNLFGDKV